MSTKPLTEDEELENEITGFVWQGGLSDRQNEKNVSDVVKLIATYTSQKALEELEQFHFNWASQFTSGPRRYLEERIATLKQESEG